MFTVTTFTAVLLNQYLVAESFHVVEKLIGNVKVLLEFVIESRPN